MAYNAHCLGLFRAIKYSITTHYFKTVIKLEELSFCIFLSTITAGPRQLTANQLTASKLTADNADWLKRAILNIFLLSPEPSCLNPHFVTKSGNEIVASRSVCSRSVCRGQLTCLTASKLTADNADWLKRAILNIFLLSPEPSCLNPHFVTKSGNEIVASRSVCSRSVCRGQLSVCRGQFVALDYGNHRGFSVKVGYFFKTNDVMFFFLGVNAVNDVNNALLSNDKEAVLLALQNPALQLHNVDPNNITHYLRLLNKKKAEKAEETGDPDVALWIDEIQACIDLANRQTRIALKRKWQVK